MGAKPPKALRATFDRICPLRWNIPNASVPPTTPTPASGFLSAAKASSNEAPAGFQNGAFSFDGSDLPGQDQSAAQMRMRLLLMGVASTHHYIAAVAPALEETPIGFELERSRHVARGLREHLILGDDGMSIGATRTKWGSDIRYARSPPALCLRR